VTSLITPCPLFQDKNLGESMFLNDTTYSTHRYITVDITFWFKKNGMITLTEDNFCEFGYNTAQ
jgi:hypothetical protein